MGKTRKASIKRTLITGLIILTPILVSVWIVRFVFLQIHQSITPAVLNLLRLLGVGPWLETTFVNVGAPIFSVALAVAVIYLLGLLGGNVIGRQLLEGFERLLMQIPVVRGIYSATRQFLDTFSRDSNQAFRKVVLVEYPRKGLWTMALLTNETKGEVALAYQEPMVSVFIPTTPNPTSGWLLFVPKKDVIELTMSVDEAFKMIISGGVLTPDAPSQTPNPTQS
jgi:uncharacterized membrane protein